MTTLLQGDCLELLKDIPDKSVDLIVTDPPYELPLRKGGGSQGHKVASVMKECEQLGIVNGFNENILNECMRVMRKPNIYISSAMRGRFPHTSTSLSAKGAPLIFLYGLRTIPFRHIQINT